MSDQKTILVTGGCGFIGSHIVDRLIEDGVRVVVLDDLSTGTVLNLNQKAIFYQGDAGDRMFVDKIFKQHQFSCVIHQATKINTNVLHEDPSHDVHCSISSTIALSENCIRHNVDKLIFASSVAVYGRPANLPATEDSPILPISSYGIAKYCAESYLRYFSVNCGLKYQILRYVNVFGPRQPIYGEVGVIAIYTDRVVNDENLVIFGDGGHERDYIYVSDIVDFTLQAIAMDKSSIFNVGRGVPVTVNELFSVFQKYDPTGKEAVRKPERYGEIGSFFCDISSALATGWRWKVDLEEGIEKTISSFNDK
jgi:UDP-glucose 4-epimerase